MTLASGTCLGTNELLAPLGAEGHAQSPRPGPGR